MRSLKQEQSSSARKSASRSEANQDAESIKEKADLELVKNKAVWKIAPGEIARRISEKEIVQIDNLKGIVIQEGVTAYIYMNGEEVAQLDGGSYSFINESEVKEAVKDKEKEQKIKDGDASIITKAWRGIVKLITGKKKQKAKQKERRRLTKEEVVRRLTKDVRFAVYLKQDRDFIVTFGQKDVNGIPEFMPIRTQNVDAGIALQLNLRISDFHEFITQYLTDRKFVTPQIIQGEMMPWIKSIVARVMRVHPVDEMGVPEDARLAIWQELQNLNEELHGLQIVKLIDVTCNNDDFERLRQLSQEQYLANKELDFLIRSHEFENRLADANNTQTIQEAASDRDLMFALDEINKDKLLHEDELDKFYVLLSRQKRLRDAKNDLEEARIMNDIRGTQLLSDDQLAEIEHSIAMKVEGRENVSELLRIKGLFDQDKARLSGEIELDDIQRGHERKTTLENADLESELLDKDLSKQKRVDSYSDERDDVELQKRVRAAEAQRELDKKLAEDNLDNLRQKQEMSMSAMERLKQMEAAEAELRHQHEMDKERLAHEARMKQLQNESEMSTDKLFVSKLSELKDNEAANIFAESFSSQKEMEAAAKAAEEKSALEREMREQQQKMMEQQMAQQQAMMDRMMGFAEKGMSTAADIAASRTKDITAQKEEYREQMHHEQQRIDATQDKALNYTTRVTQSQAKGTSTPKVPIIKVPSMGNVVLTMEQLRPLCQAGTITGKTILDIDGERTFAEDCVELAALFASNPPAKASISCPHCGMQIEPDGRWCPECGNEL